MKPKISIITPVYNVENYLKETIDSILSQTFTDFQLILVNDGSTDKSGDICDLYGKKDNRITVIHKENGGVSSARNIGLDNAKGEYIGFVDSDDLIDTNMYELLLNTAIKENADIVQCEHNRKFSKNNNSSFSYIKISSKELIDKQYTLNSGRCTNILSLWSKIYKREIFDNIRFPLNRTYEDHAMMCQIIAKAHNILISDTVLYHYIERGNSIITGFSPKKCKDKVLALYDNVLFLKNYDEDLYKKSIISLRNCLFSTCHLLPKSERNFYFNFIKTHYKLLIHDSNKYDKIYLFLIRLGILKNFIADKDFEPIQKIIRKIK